MKIVTFHLLTSDGLDEYLTIVKSLVRDFPLWFVKTSISDQTSTEVLSFQTLSNFNVHFSSRVTSLTLSCNLNSDSNLVPYVLIFVSESGRDY